MQEAAGQPWYSCVEKRRKMCVCSLPTLHPSFSGMPGPVPPGQRYFVLEDGILHYATTRQDVSQVPGLGCGGSLPRDVLSR